VHGDPAACWRLALPILNRFTIVQISNETRRRVPPGPPSKPKISLRLSVSGEVKVKVKVKVKVPIFQIIFR
jgi:hypothetical protein